jgi:hypothetical protein
MPGPTPPKAKAEELEAPNPPGPYLPVFKSFNSVQAEPFQDSVFADCGATGKASPPKISVALFGA